MLILSAVRHFVRITLFIAVRLRPEAQLSMCFLIMKDEDSNSQGQVV